jgi:hypothetical protein
MRVTFIWDEDSPERRNVAGVVGHHRRELWPFEPCRRLRGVNADFQRECRVPVNALKETHRITRECIGMVDLKLLNDFVDDFTLSRLPSLGVRALRTLWPTTQDV